MSLSVVVVCINGLAVLRECLSALMPQAASGDVEILAIGRWDETRGAPALQACYPEINWVSVPSASTVPQMRIRAMNQSRGEIVALLEDDCVAASNWCNDIIRAHQAPFSAIGGPVEPSSTYRPMDWAMYFCEYGRFTSPFSGSVSALPGNNVSYKRAVLTEVKDDAGFYDVFFHRLLRKSGKLMLADSRVVVRNVNHWSFAHLTVIPFHHGRAFAGFRAADFPLWRRWLYALLTCGLPAVKVGRVARDVLRRHRNGENFVRSLHWTVLFMLSWSLGEFLGYLMGAGGSGSRWR